MYASPALIQGANDRPGKFDYAAWSRLFGTREGRNAYKDTYREIPRWLLPPAEQKRRHADDTVDVEHERAASWLVAEIIFPMIERNSRRALGYCNATEYTLRLWAWVDTGHLYGERSISRRLRVEHARGRLHREVIPRGKRFKNGTESKRGTTANRFPSEKERRERLWREKHERRRQRREARQRKRAERVIAREKKPAPAVEAPREQPRTAIVDVMRERAIASYAMPECLRGLLPTITAEQLAAAEHDAIAAERARQLAAFKDAFAADLAAEKRKREPPD